MKMFKKNKVNARVLKKAFSFKNVSSFCCISLITIISGCSDFLEVDPPNNEIVSSTVFVDDATATAAVNALYSKMTNTGFADGGIRSITVLKGLSSDELQLNLSDDGVYETFYTNNYLSFSSTIETIWSDFYYLIYSSNAVIEGLEQATGVTNSTKNQLRGEALFVRAFCHFFLANLFGDAPYITTTDYRQNSNVTRTPVNEIYQGVIEDLLNSQDLLQDEYITTERVRLNKAGATAFLSRVYLYAGEWENAEAAASVVIDNPMYSLVDLNEIFLKNSSEAIWQLVPSSIGSTNNTQDGSVFVPLGTGIPVISLNEDLVASFEADDLRKVNWIGSIVDNTTTYYYPNKYKLNQSTSVSEEYTTIFRLAEQYLIRAEARAQQENIDGALNDLNVIRQRAGLGDLSGLTQTQTFDAIYHERFAELFSEWAHRWFDLKRTDRSEAILKDIKPSWDNNYLLLPIPDSEILVNKNLQPQNPGY